MNADRAATSFEDAVAAIRAACAPLAAQRIALDDASGRVLAGTLVADDDLVPFARSAMDGYAVRAADTFATPLRVAVRGRIYAERTVERRHEPGTATAIATGAALPLGADAVIPFEDVAADAGTIVIARSVAAGAHVFPPGEDARRGDVLAHAGDRLSPATLGLLAAAGHATLEVVRRPRTVVLTSGEEIVPVSAAPRYGEIRNSNAAALVAGLTAFGAEVVRHVHVRDDRRRLRDALEEAANGADLVVTTGGASVGERDFVKPALDELEAVFAFRAVAMRPARPTAFARLGPTRIAALSGNPAAAFVALQQLVRVAVTSLQGCGDPRLPRIRARLRGTLHGKGDRTYFAFVAIVVDSQGRLEAIPLGNQCSALTRTALDASGFAVLEPGRGDVANGEVIAVDIFDWGRVHAAVSAASASPSRG